MMNNNHKNSGCGFSEEIVSLLYGETDAAGNPEFEKHLESCSVCADELAAFSGVHFAINDWKSKEFANLRTPLIEIPYPTAAVAPHKPQAAGAKVSWLEKMRDLFTPSWSLAGAAMAVLAVCVGLVFFASISRNGSEVAGTNKNSKIQVSPTAERSAEQTNANSRRNPQTDRETLPLDNPAQPQPELVVEQNPKNNRAVKTVNTQRRTPKAETRNLPKTEDAKRDDKKKNEIPPKIFEDEEEDDTLRLAEMLEEVDTVE